MSRTCETKNCKNRCCKYPSGSWKPNCNECSLESLEIGQHVDNTILSTQIQNLQNTILELQNTVLELKEETTSSFRVMNHDIAHYIFKQKLHKK